MTEAEAALERGERDRAMLEWLAELGMALAEAIVEQTKEAGAAQAGAAFAKVAQAVRRTIVLKDHLATGAGKRRIDLLVERGQRREQALADHAERKKDAIMDEVISAAYERDGDTEAADSVIDEARDILELGDEYRDFLRQPVGESIARLCRDLGLDPEWCVKTEAGWVAKSEPFIPRRAPWAIPFPRGPMGEADWDEWLDRAGEAAHAHRGATGPPPAIPG